MHTKQNKSTWSTKAGDGLIPNDKINITKNFYYLRGVMIHSKMFKMRGSSAWYILYLKVLKPTKEDHTCCRFHLWVQLHSGNRVLVKGKGHIQNFHNIKMNTVSRFPVCKCLIPNFRPIQTVPDPIWPVSPLLILII